MYSLDFETGSKYLAESRSSTPFSLSFSMWKFLVLKVLPRGYGVDVGLYLFVPV